MLERWDRHELWGLVATLVVATAQAEHRGAFAAENVRRLREAEPSLVLMLIANVTWGGDPIKIAGGIFGRLEDRFAKEARDVAAGREDLSAVASVDWVRRQTLLEGSGQNGATSRDVVACVLWTKGQMKMATHLATRWLEDICCLALLLQSAGGPAPWSLRGAHNRPGPRGLCPDRATWTKVLGESHLGSFEISFQPLVASPAFGAYQPVHWYSADPVPLDDLLVAAGPDRVTSAVLGQEAVPRRLRVAARWYADGQWSSDADDTLLALGVAIDALVGSRSGLPGRVMAQRFALLEADPSLRRDRLTRYNDVYSVRSAIAHGGETSRLDEEGFVSSVAEDVRWAADRLIALSGEFPSSTEADVGRTFEALALGTASW